MELSLIEVRGAADTGMPSEQTSLVNPLNHRNEKYGIGLVGSGRLQYLGLLYSTGVMDILPICNLPMFRISAC